MDKGLKEELLRDKELEIKKRTTFIIPELFRITFNGPESILKEFPSIKEATDWCNAEADRLKTGFSCHRANTSSNAKPPSSSNF